MKIRRIDEMVGTERRPAKVRRGGPPCLRAVALRRASVAAYFGSPQRDSPTILLSLRVAEKRTRGQWATMVEVRENLLHDEVFFDNLFVLPDLFHDSLILNHSPFEDVTSI